MEKVYVNGHAVRLEPARLIQSGGEGMIFDLGQHALKRYHRPTHRHAAKLAYMLRPELQQRWPANVLAPQALAYDDQGRLAGFRMARLPPGVYPIKKLSNAPFCQKLGLEAGHVLSLFQEIHATLSHLHRAGIVAGDLNDHNLFFGDPRQPPAGTSGAHTFWVDVDSFQCGPHPCPVATHAFLDPTLYPVKDFGRKPVFTPLTDWYAFFVLLLKSLLHVHPYGGAHHQHKSLASRAQARITVFGPDVTYPQNARPPATLSDELLAYAKQVFGAGQRERFPAGLLSTYAASLRRCPRCNLAYPRNRPDCPGCGQGAPALPAIPAANHSLRCFLRVDGIIQHVALQPGGRLVAIVRSGSDYRLLRAGTGGLLGEFLLFQGRPGYRFGFFEETVVVNDPDSRRLLLLATGDDAPRRVAVLESDPYRDRPVFATTPTHLYRLASGCLLQGALRHGQYVEEVVATVHRHQTQIWADPAADRVAGCYRIFDRYHFFIVDEDGRNYEVETAPPPGREDGQPGSVQEMAAAFGREQVAFLWQTARAGRTHSYGQLTSARGATRFRFRPEPPGVQGRMLAGDTLLAPAEGAIRQQAAGGSSALIQAPFLTATDHLLPHPAGILISQPAALYLLRC